MRSAINCFVITAGMLFDRTPRFLLTVAGVGVAFFLSASQIGLLVGWCNTNSALIRNSASDIWVMSPQTPAFDYGSAIPRNRIYQVRSVPGVAWAEGMFVGWNTWRRRDGRRVVIELVGLDESSLGGPWAMHVGCVDDVHRPDTVVVDQLHQDLLGVEHVGQEVEITDGRAVVGGISREIRTFTASPFVFTSIDLAIRYDKRYRPDEVTYVLARCARGYSAEQVRDLIRGSVPDVEVLTSHEFAVRTVKYWMLKTGAGITVVVTAAFGLLVGVFVTSQTLAAITHDHLPSYATLVALGFARGRLLPVVMLQGLVLGVCGDLVGGLGFAVASRLTAATAIPLEMEGRVFTALVATSLASCVLAAISSVRSINKVDPVLVFRV